MEDKQIMALYWQREERAIAAYQKNTWVSLTSPELPESSAVLTVSNRSLV